MNRTPLEKEIEKKIGLYAKSKGCLYMKFTSPAHRAVPDRIIITPSGVVGFLEVKRHKAKPTALQMAEMLALKNQGANVGWVDNVLDGQQFVNLLTCVNNKPVVMGRGLV